MLYKFHTNWIHQNGTSFTATFTDENLARILEKYWLGEMVPNLVERSYLGRRQYGNLSGFLKQYKMHLLHNLKILPKTNICSCAHIDNWMELQMGGGD